MSSRQKYSAHDRAFDHSPEGERMRRYETTCNRYVDRYISELLKRKSNNGGNGYAPAAHGIHAASATGASPDGWPERFSRKGRDGRFDRFDPKTWRWRFKLQISKSEIRKGERRTEPAASPDGELRNEPKGAGASSSKSEIRNPKEGKGNGTDGDAGRELRNEPNADGSDEFVAG